MKRIVTLSVLGFLGMLFTASALAKGQTVKLSILGPGISSSIDTTDAATIAANVWGGNFVDLRRVAQSPAANLPRYTVQFYVKVPRKDGARMMYVVHYVWDPEAGRALVYFPGSGEEWYGMNISAIIRDGMHGYDGQWYYATDAWGRAIRGVLPRQ